MPGSRILGGLAVAWVAIVAAPACAMSQTTTDTVEQEEIRRGAHDATAWINDSRLTTKSALVGDDGIKGGLVGVAAVKGTVSRRGKADSTEARVAAASGATTVEDVKSVKHDLPVVPPGDRAVIGTSDKDITRPVEGRLSKDTMCMPMAGRSFSGVPWRALGPARVAPSWPGKCRAFAWSRTS